jgi:hypothetical protein
MATVKSKSRDAVKKQQATTPRKEPKRLSKFALWRKENPNGIFEYVDWQAINK